MAGAVGYDAQGNEVDAAGDIIAETASFEDPAYTEAVHSTESRLTPAQRRNRYLAVKESTDSAEARRANQAARLDAQGKANRAKRIAQVRARGTPAEVAAVIEQEVAHAQEAIVGKKAAQARTVAETAARNKRVDEQQTKKDAETLRLTKAEHYLKGLESGITDEAELKDYVEMKLSEDAGVMASFQKTMGQSLQLRMKVSPTTGRSLKKTRQTTTPHRCCESSLIMEWSRLTGHSGLLMPCKKASGFRLIRFKRKWPLPRPT